MKILSRAQKIIKSPRRRPDGSNFDLFPVNPYLDNERGYEGYYDENSYDDDFEDKKRSMFRKRGGHFF